MVDKEMEDEITKILRETYEQGVEHGIKQSELINRGKQMFRTKEEKEDLK